MPVFRDHDGNVYDIPNEALEKYKVKGELAEGKQLGGGEIPSAAYNYAHPAAYNYVPPGAAYNYVPDAGGAQAARAYNYVAHGGRAYNYVPPGGAVYNYAPTENTRAVAAAAQAHNYPAGVPSGTALYFWDAPAPGAAERAKEGTESSGG
jgi:hypothetical protein